MCVRLLRPCSLALIGYLFQGTGVPRSHLFISTKIFDLFFLRFGKRRETGRAGPCTCTIRHGQPRLLKYLANAQQTPRSAVDASYLKKLTLFFTVCLWFNHFAQIPIITLQIRTFQTLYATPLIVSNHIMSNYPFVHTYAPHNIWNYPIVKALFSIMRHSLLFSRFSKSAPFICPKCFFFIIASHFLYYHHFRASLPFKAIHLD